MHPAEIKAAIEMAGYFQTDIASALGVAPQTVGAVIKGITRSHRIEARIAVTIGRPPQEIWPKWYDKAGKPIRQRRRPVRMADTLSRLAAAGAAAPAGAR